MNTRRPTGTGEFLRYYVRDYYAYDLAPPRRGYVYVRPYEDAETFCPVQLATGLNALHASPLGGTEADRLVWARSCSYPPCEAVPMRIRPFLLPLLLACGPTFAQAYDGPIIDVHLHVGRAAPGAPNPATGQPTTANTDAEREAFTLERMRRHGIVLGLVSGPAEAMASMREAGGDAIWAGAFLDDGRTPLPPPEELRAAFERGGLRVMGEIGAQYHGLDPSDPWFEPYLAIAEEFDIPVGIHTGLAPPGTPYGCCPDFRIELGNPLVLEPMLKRHPNLRVWLMHAGWPFLEETKALLYMYPQVHADVSVIDWIIPREEFHAYLEALVRAGLADRLMFGSDQMVWPEAITQAIEGVDSAPFLTPEDKRAIFHDNAVRFLRLGKTAGLP